MLREAVKARIPIISVQSKEGPFTEGILKTVLGGRSMAISGPVHRIKEKGIYYWLHPGKQKLREVHDFYTALNDARATVVMVNPEVPSEYTHDAGQLVAPESLRDDFLRRHVVKENRGEVKEALAGTTYKSMVDYCKLAMAACGELTGKSIATVRAGQMERVLGLQPLPTDASFYVPPIEVSEWVEELKVLLSADVPPLLRPRGALFEGISGTGKTMAAKYIARAIGRPLYLLEFGVLLSKWHGESDQNFVRCLDRAERESPCILLIDEVEKLFNTSVDEGVVSRLLATLLWWLQEHRSPILTLMTTNDVDKLPPELYRRGRLSQVVEFHPLRGQAAVDFATEYAKLVGVEYTVPEVPDGTRAVIAERLIRAARESYLGK